MEHRRRRLGRTDLEVFPLDLGGNVFGWTADRQASFAVLDAYVAAGGNFVDTADVYSKWVAGHRGGESEEMLGAWLRERRGTEMIVATKVGMGGPLLEAGLSAAQIRTACEGSLRRLKVERIDLYYAHVDDPKTPLEESLGAFDALVREGKVRWLGASNHGATRLREALDTSARLGLARYEVVQPKYNLLARGDFEGAQAELCIAEGLGVCTWHALASGVLTGKYDPDLPPEGSRAKGAATYLAHPRIRDVLGALRTVAARHRATPVQVALAWLLARPAVTAPIASATSAAQLEEQLGALRLELTAEDLAALDAASS